MPGIIPRLICIWSEDECTRSLPGHNTINDKWMELFGESFDVKNAIRVIDGQDCINYSMPNDCYAYLSFNGWSIWVYA